MARVSSKSKSNPKPKTEKIEEPEANALKRKRVEAVNNLVRARDGSAFTRCEECNKDVPVMLVDMHNCSLESKIKMKMESMVVERAVEDKKPAEKNKSGKSSAPKPRAKKAKSSDPNAPKKPRTPFFIFMDDFRKQYKAEHPDNKSVAMVGKAAGEKWKAMSEEEKKVYLDKAEESKAEYAEAMAKLNSQSENTEEQADKVVNELEDDIEEEETAEPEKEDQL